MFITVPSNLLSKASSLPENSAWNSIILNALLHKNGIKLLHVKESQITRGHKYLDFLTNYLCACTVCELKCLLFHLRNSSPTLSITSLTISPSVAAQSERTKGEEKKGRKHIEREGKE